LRYLISELCNGPQDATVHAAHRADNANAKKGQPTQAIKISNYLQAQPFGPISQILTSLEDHTEDFR